MDETSSNQMELYKDDRARRSPFDTAKCRNEVVTVTLVTETFAFAINESISTVLVPASAFPTNENTSLCDCIARGDCLLVVAHPLMQRSGCQWVAMYAKKITQEDVPQSSQCSSQIRDTPTPDELLQQQKGYAVVYFVSKGMAYAHNRFGEVVTCPALTWIGGNKGNVEAEGLDEVIAIGDMVYYEAHHTAKGWRAQRWSMREPAAGSSDSFTQTAMTFEQMLIRAVGPELADFLRQRIPNILAYAAL
uniref:DUF7930 domain-containing protein n=1 Tax=Parascaris univalens TaxID=6257 RepID=A0A915AGP7_PARUN